MAATEGAVAAEMDACVRTSHARVPGRTAARPRTHLNGHKAKGS